MPLPSRLITNLMLSKWTRRERTSPGIMRQALPIAAALALGRSRKNRRISALGEIRLLVTFGLLRLAMMNSDGRKSPHRYEVIPAGLDQPNRYDLVFLVRRNDR